MGDDYLDDHEPYERILARARDQKQILVPLEAVPGHPEVVTYDRETEPEPGEPTKRKRRPYVPEGRDEESGRIPPSKRHIHNASPPPQFGVHSRGDEYAFSGEERVLDYQDEDWAPSRSARMDAKGTAPSYDFAFTALMIFLALCAIHQFILKPRRNRASSSSRHESYVRQTRGPRVDADRSRG